MNQEHKSGKQKNKGARNHPSTDGNSLLLERRTRAEEALRLVTLSWEMRDKPDFSVTEFLETLRAWRSQEIGAYDLVICAGRTLPKALPPADILAASGSVPVLYEAWGKKVTPWFVAHTQPGGPTSTIMRATQLVLNSKSDAHCHDDLASVLAQNKGVILFKDFSLPFVLFICGENNTLEYRCRKSVLRRSSSMRPPPKVLCADWVALNPAHHPYRSPIPMTGFAKIARTNCGKGPTPGMLVEKNTTPYTGKTRAPLALLHANNFCSENTQTERNASVAFSRKRTAVAAPPKPLAGTLSALRYIEWAGLSTRGRAHG